MRPATDNTNNNRYLKETHSAVNIESADGLALLDAKVYAAMVMKNAGSLLYDSVKN